MNITYTKQGDYLLPDFKLPETEPQEIGLWGRRHEAYLKEYKKITCCNLLTSGKLNQYLADIDKQAQELSLRLVRQMAEQEGITETLKAENPMKWVGRMNSVRNRAEEVVLAELIYV